MFYSTRAEVQATAGNAALFAAKYLPFNDQARLAATRLVGEGEFAMLDVSASGVTVQIEEAFQPVLLSYFGVPELRYQVAATANVNPKDVVIFMDNSSYMAPRFYHHSDKPAWGKHGEDGHWQASKFFLKHRRLLPKHDPQEEGDIINHARLYTQQCFNPMFSAYKEAAIRLYDYFSSNSANSVGVMMGPRHARPDEIFTVRDVMPAGSARGTFGYYRSPYANAYFSDEYCLAIAESQPQNNDDKAGYWVPPISAELPGSKDRGSLRTNARGPRSRCAGGRRLCPSAYSHFARIQNFSGTRCYKLQHATTSLNNCLPIKL